jgi:hypothetical protein
VLRRIFGLMSDAVTGREKIPEVGSFITCTLHQVQGVSFNVESNNNCVLQYNSEMRIRSTLA